MATVAHFKPRFYGENADASSNVLVGFFDIRKKHGTELKIAPLYVEADVSRLIL